VIQQAPESSAAQSWTLETHHLILLLLRYDYCAVLVPLEAMFLIGYTRLQKKARFTLPCKILYSSKLWCTPVKTRIIEPCAMKSKIPPRGAGAGQKTQQKHRSFPSSETEKKRKKFLALLRDKSPTTCGGTRFNYSSFYGTWSGSITRTPHQKHPNYDTVPYCTVLVPRNLNLFYKNHANSDTSD